MALTITISNETVRRYYARVLLNNTCVVQLYDSAGMGIWRDFYITIL